MRSNRIVFFTIFICSIFSQPLKTFGQDVVSQRHGDWESSAFTAKDNTRFYLLETREEQRNNHWLSISKNSESCNMFNIYVVVNFDNPAPNSFKNSGRGEIRVDGNQIRGFRWNIDVTSGDKKMIFFISNMENPNTLYNELLIGKKVRIHMIPPSGKDDYFRFSLSGFAKGFERILFLCEKDGPINPSPRNNGQDDSAYFTRKREKKDSEFFK